MTNKDPMMASFGFVLLLNPMIKAKQVMIADVAPKLNFVRCDIATQIFSYAI